MDKGTVKPPYTVVLTHDVDVISLSEIGLGSRTFWGFPYRCIVQNLKRTAKGDMSVIDYIGSFAWGVSCMLPKIGVLADPWLRGFSQLISIERDLGVRSTLFLMPFSGTPGHLSDGTPAPAKREAHYRLEKWRDCLLELRDQGWEIGCHGIDCHLSPEAARMEYERIAYVFGQTAVGLRMHWLVTSKKLLENARHAGFLYDSTTGYNEGAGYPSEWIRPFCDAQSGLPVVPLHIQDTALMGEWRLGLTRREAARRIHGILDQAARQSGVVTVLWHTNSFAPPRYWGDVYVEIIRRALSDGARITTAGDVVCGELDIR